MAIRSFRRRDIIWAAGMTMALVILLNLRSTRSALDAVALGWANGGLAGELYILLGEVFQGILSALTNPFLIGAYGALVGMVILLENRNPDRTVAWLMALAFVPLLGILLYFILGPRFASARALRNRHREVSRLSQHGHGGGSSSLPEEFRGTFRILSELGEATPLAYREIQIMSTSSCAFDALLGAVEGARCFVHGEFFSLADDSVGRAFAELLKTKSREGVQVRLLYDGVGSWGLGHRFVEDLKASGVRVAAFLPISFPMFRREFNYRNHRKIAVVDGQIAFVGGFNVGDKYMGLSRRLGPWRDTMARLSGDAAMGLDNVFRRDWLFASSEELPLHRPVPASGLPFVQVAVGGPDSPHDDLIKHAYLSAIAEASFRIWISTPYLVPGPEILWALKNAALRGVDVRVVIPCRPDHLSVFWATRYHIAELLEAGARVFLYQKGFIHAKTLLADRYLASVGTVNMDVRSLEINYEVQTFMFGGTPPERLEADFVHDFMDSVEVTADEWGRRPALHRVLESSFRLLSPEL